MQLSTNLEKIAFFGDGHGGIAAYRSLSLYFKKIEILTNDKDIKSLIRSTDKLVESIEEIESNLVICAGYKKIISKEFLRKKTVINTHPSLLPKYRGMHSVAWAILNMEEELGFSIHLMNEYIDDGDILEQFKVKYESQTSQEIMKLFDDYVSNNLGRVVLEFFNKKIIPLKQDKTKATWVSKRNLNDCILDFNSNNRYIAAMFRALVEPYPLPLIKFKDNLYEITSFKLIDVKYEMHNGRVLNIENKSAYVKTSEGILIINSLRDIKTKEKIFPSDIFKIGTRL